MEKNINLKIPFSLIEKQEDESFASVNLNPTVAWAKFILTDDLPNYNKQRVPEGEFDNLINTGVYMPIKMAEGGIADGHEGAVPIGVIAHLKKVKNQIHGLAALWNRERPEDVQLIRDYYKDGKPLELSWEILYTQSTVSEEGVEDLQNTALRAVTLVGMPAYEGRTAIIAVAQKHLEEQKLELQEALDKIAELEKTLQEKETVLTEKDSSLNLKDEELKTIKEQLSELDELKKFKADIEKERADAGKLDSIKQKFSAAKLEKDETYFTENKEMLLSLDDKALDFIIQELVSFSSLESKSSKGKHGLPQMPRSPSDDVTDPIVLGEELRNLRNKQINGG